MTYGQNATDKGKDSGMSTTTIGDVIRDRIQRERQLAEQGGFRKSGTVGTWQGGESYLYVECGGPRFLRVTGIRSNGWVVTGSGLDASSWCVCSDEPLYVKAA